MSPLACQLIATDLGQLTKNAVVTKQADGTVGRGSNASIRPSGHSRTLLFGFADIAIGLSEQLSQILIAKPTDGEPRISDRGQQFKIFAGRLECSDTASPAAFALGDTIKN